MRLLEDGWEPRGRPGDTWRWRSGPGRPEGAPGWPPARVPMLDLLPGESTRAPVTRRDAPPEGRAPLLEGWNIRARVLD
ncbi:hypothetical protein [Streptomyces sp. HNM1019]|uniref:hypothetical protein n=1 Tax=Streptomyces sp. HNM1019 TaxID=3424717 RepID=UPI003D781043